MILGKARHMYTQINALTSKNCTTTVYKESLAFIAPELIIEELSIASAEIGKLKTVDIWAVLMTLFAMLNPDQSYPFQNDSKNVLNKESSNMEAAFKQELQKQAYPFFSVKYLPVQALC